MRRRNRSGALATLFALLLLVAAAGPADAKTKRFKPLAFTLAGSKIANAIQLPYLVGANSLAATFVAPLGLPVGSTINAIRLYSTGGGNSRGVSVRREVVGSSATVVFASTNQVWTSDDTPMMTSGPVPDPDYMHITGGAYYYVRIDCSPSTQVWAVDVDYTP